MFIWLAWHQFSVNIRVDLIFIPILNFAFKLNDLEQNLLTLETLDHVHSFIAMNRTNVPTVAVMCYVICCLENDGHLAS